MWLLHGDKCGVSLNMCSQKLDKVAREGNYNCKWDMNILRAAPICCVFWILRYNKEKCFYKLYYAMLGGVSRCPKKKK